MQFQIKTRLFAEMFKRATMLKSGVKTRVFPGDDPTTSMAIESRGGRKTLRSSDGRSMLVLDVTSCCVADLMDEDGAILLPRDRGLRMLESLRTPEATIEYGLSSEAIDEARRAKTNPPAGPDCVRIVARGAMFEVPWIDPLGYPAEEHRLPPDHADVLASDFARMVEQTIFATDDESTRYALGSIQVEFEGESGAGRVRFVATDGRRLAISEASSSIVGSPRPGTSSSPGLVPAGRLKTMAALARISASGSDDASVRFGYPLGSNGNLRFYAEGPDWSYACPLGEGRFPRYRETLGNLSSAGTLAFPDSQALLGAVEQASITTSDESRGLGIFIRPTATLPLVIASQAADVGSSTVTVREAPATDFEGEICITMAANYLAQGLRAFRPGEAVTVGFGGPEAAVVLSSADYRHIIQPLTREPGRPNALPEGIEGMEERIRAIRTDGGGLDDGAGDDLVEELPELEPEEAAV